MMDSVKTVYLFPKLIIIQSFNDAQEWCKTKSKEIQNLPSERQLEIEALAKQATIGDCNTERPGILDFKGKAEWDAWDAKRGMSTTDAMKRYVEIAKDALYYK